MNRQAESLPKFSNRIRIERKFPCRQQVQLIQLSGRALGLRIEEPQRLDLIIEQIDADVVLTDLRMPGMDGLQLLNRLKQLRPQTMVILMTAYGTVKNAVRAMKNGAEDYLAKPLDIEELEVVVERAIEKKRLIEEARSMGYDRMRLDSARFMKAAHVLYHSLGFHDIEPYEGSEIPLEFQHYWVFMELRLV